MNGAGHDQGDTCVGIGYQPSLQGRVSLPTQQRDFPPLRVSAS